MTERSDRNITHGPAPADAELFADTPTPKPRRTPRADDPGTPLFAENRPAKRTPPAARKPYPRWRDEDMPLRPGDVIAVGITHNRVVFGEVTAVNDHAFRLNGYSPLRNQFNTGTTIIGWRQVVEFGPVADRRTEDHSLIMEPLLEWADNWQPR